MDEVVLTLRDGRAVRARRLRPEDAHRLQEGLAELSERSRIQRFHAGMSKLSRSQLRYLSEVDQVHHLAWGVIDPDRPDHGGLGVVRAVQLAHEPGAAEFAVVVRDDHQRQGLGALLVGLIALDASAHGYTALTGRVARSNVAMLGLLDALGADVRETDDPAAVDRILPLGDLAAWPPSAALDRIRANLPAWPHSAA